VVFNLGGGLVWFFGTAPVQVEYPIYCRCPDDWKKEAAQNIN